MNYIFAHRNPYILKNWLVICCLFELVLCIDSLCQENEYGEIKLNHLCVCAEHTSLWCSKRACSRVALCFYRKTFLYRKKWTSFFCKNLTAFLDKLIGKYEDEESWFENHPSQLSASLTVGFIDEKIWINLQVRNLYRQQHIIKFACYTHTCMYLL